MLNPWIINNKIYNNCMLSLNMNLKQKATNDYTRASYNRPMVLLFSDNVQAEKFTLEHATNVGRTSVIMKDRSLPQSIKTQVASTAEMVLIHMPDKVRVNSPEEQEPLHVLGTQQLNAIGDDIMLNLAVVSYALFYYVEHFYENENNNLTLNGIVINPLLEVDDDIKRDVIMRYLDRMYST